ncbi:hypothetical protein BDR26DRAFT_919462 [Obelidium mucronatum]|nr:hypothetical protein BDR26DRAFT_919462 [Obelidium mucronatum]
MGNETSKPSDESPRTSAASTAAPNPSLLGGPAASAAAASAFVFSGFDGAPARETRPVFSALVAAASAARAKRGAAGGGGVRLFVALNGDDCLWERNALAKDVFPFLRRFSRVLGIDFVPLDLVLAGFSMNASTILLDLPSFVFLTCFDYRGQVWLHLHSNLYSLLSNSILLVDSCKDDDFKELLHTWYKLDTNTNPPQYSLVSIDAIYPSLESRKVLWETTKLRLSAALIESSNASLKKDSDTYRIIHGSRTDFQVGSFVAVFIISVGSISLFPPATGTTSINEFQYFDTPTTTSTQIDVAAAKKVLLSKIKPKRTYSVPWSVNPKDMESSAGFNPATEKAHAAYIKTFCDDAARILAETRTSDEESKFILKVSDGFVGREDILAKLRDFAVNEDGQEAVCVVYGSSGIGKSAVLAKFAQSLSDTSSVIVSRFVGKNCSNQWDP